MKLEKPAGITSKLFLYLHLVFAFVRNDLLCLNLKCVLNSVRQLYFGTKNVIRYC